MPTYEDPSAYTEVDTGNHLTETSTKVTHSGAIHHEDTYLYKDHGAAHFAGSFRHNFDFRFTATLVSFNEKPYFLANSINEANTIIDSLAHVMGIQMEDWDGSKYKLRLHTDYNGSHSGTNTGFNYSLNTTYYAQVFFDVTVGTFGTWYLKIYGSDADRTANASVLDSVSLAALTTVSFRYLYLFNSYNTSGSSNTDAGYSENYDLSAPAPGVNYTLTLDYLLYTLALQTLGLTKALTLALNNLSYSITLIALGLTRGYTLVLDYLSYILSLQIVLFTKSLNLVLNVIQYTLSLQAIVFTKQLIITVSYIAYTLTLQSIRVLVNGSVTFWVNKVKPSVMTVANRVKPSAMSLVNKVKPSASGWINKPKP